LFLLGLGYALSWVLPRRADSSLENLTIWTSQPPP
jgi:hypothetical protein